MSAGDHSQTRDERPGALIGAGGTQRSDWPERVQLVDFQARSDLFSLLLGNTARILPPI